MLPKWLFLSAAFRASAGFFSGFSVASSLYVLSQRSGLNSSRSLSRIAGWEVGFLRIFGWAVGPEFWVAVHGGDAEPDHDVCGMVGLGRLLLAVEVWS